MRIGLEQERSERVSYSTSQVFPCGLSRSENRVHGNVLRIFNFHRFSAEALKGWNRGSAVTFSLERR